MSHSRRAHGFAALEERVLRELGVDMAQVHVRKR